MVWWVQRACGYPGWKFNVVNQINSGNDLLMPGLPKQKNAILDALNSGKISQETANRNVKNILQLVFVHLHLQIINIRIDQIPKKMRILQEMQQQKV